jgi:hypothetical protein
MIQSLHGTLFDGMNIQITFSQAKNSKMHNSKWQHKMWSDIEFYFYFFVPQKRKLHKMNLWKSII